MSETFKPVEQKWAASSLRSRSSDVTFNLKLAVYLAGIYYGIKLVYAPNLTLQIIGMFIIGAFFAHGVELQHQVLHNQGLSNKYMNEFVGVLLGIPLLVSYAGYQASHLRHHKNLGTSENKELFDYGDQYGEGKSASLLVWLKRIFMPSLYISFLGGLWRALTFRPFDGESPDVSRRMRRDYVVVLFAIIFLSTASRWTGSILIFKVWLIPLVLFAAPIHAFIEFPEHFSCNVKTTSVFENTRSIKSNAFMTWFTNGNNYHVEHHLMPGLPIDRLHDLHASIADQILHYYPTYRSFYGALFSGRLRNGSTRSTGE
ncbi:fatty acid desaturase family protein [Trinickia mobilis]|uniref:fatty acid desaturase family protein n=1 Tax=Trinickia mobilis TaxID=2816356 RepID=UPI001A8FCC89|nr:fatty acid desaturase [Trinickia mobilis]